MIGRDEIGAALVEHMQAMVVAQSAGVAPLDITWALPQGLDVDDEALFEAASTWATATARVLTTVAGASGEGFASGFLVACRVLAERES